MKWTFVIEQKVKAALILGSIMGLIILFTILEQKNMADMNRSVTSIYNDRLIPATDIFYLSEHLYGKRFLMEQHLQSDSNLPKDIDAQLSNHDKNINILIRKFEKTYLVDEESKYLKDLKNEFTYYLQIERNVLALSNQNSKAAAKALYEREGRKAHQGTIKRLAELTKIQTQVGSELIKDSKGSAATASMISNVQIGLAIITGLLIIALVFASRVTKERKEKYHWN